MCCEALLWPPDQAWALLEWRAGDYGQALALFTGAAETCEPHAPMLAAWAAIEVRPSAVGGLLSCLEIFSSK